MAGKRGIGALAAVFAVGLTVWAAPKLWVSQDVFDFGEVFDGIVVQQVFVLQNVGDELLQITRVAYNCGCTSYTLERRELQPGETTELTIRFNTTGYSSGAQPVSQTVTIYSNDPVGTSAITVRGRVLPPPGAISGGSEEPAVARTAPGGEAVVSDPPLKPTLVNLQVDLVTREDAEAVLPFLELIESYGWYTTVYVTGEIALAYPDLVKEIHDRGHQIGVLGWEAGEDLLSLAEDELYDRLENAFLAVRAAVGEMRPAYIADFKPQGYRVNDTLLRVLSRLEVRSCTGEFPAGPEHPHHLDRFDIVAVPLAKAVSGDGEPGDGIVLVDSEYLRRGKSLERFFADLLVRYDRNRGAYRPVAVAVHPALVALQDDNLSEARALAQRVANTHSYIAVVDHLTVQANPFISWMRIEVPATARAGQRLPITVRYYANCHCPWYYFQLYMCTETGLNCTAPLVGRFLYKWQGKADRYVPAGEHQLTFYVDLPVLAGDYTARLAVVGQACHGGPCWPTYSEKMIPRYDAIAHGAVQVKDYNAKFLFVPVNWTGTREQFEAVARAHVRNFVQATPLGDCPGVSLDAPDTWPVLITALNPQTQNLQIAATSCTGLNGILWNLTSGLLGAIKRFAQDQGVGRTLYNIIVGLSNERQMCVGENPDGVKYDGVSNKQDTTWLLSATDSGLISGRRYVLAHEVGHIGTYGGLIDEYCSRDAGSTDNRCSSATAQPNPLCADQGTCGCDCPSDGTTRDSGDQLCCNHDAGSTCGAVNYGPCCRGNKAGEGRCFMADATSAGGAFCDHCMARMKSMAKFSCPSFASASSPAILSLANGDRGLVVYIDLSVTRDDTVTEEHVSVEQGELRPFPHPNPINGAYALQLKDINSVLTQEFRFDLYFSHGEPPQEVDGVVVANVVSFGSFPLSIGVPFVAGTYSAVLTHGGQTIYTRVLPVGTVRGKITADGLPVEGATVYVTGQDMARAVSDAQGYYVLALREAGIYSMSVESGDPHLMPAYRSIQVEIGAIHTVDFTLGRAGSIAGWVTDAAGSPVPEAWISPRPRENEPPYYRVQDDGQYVMPGLQAGTYNVTIVAPGYADWYIYVNGQYVKRGTSVPVTVELGKTTQVDFSQRPAGAFWNFEAYASQAAAEAEGWAFTGLWRLVTQDQVRSFTPNPTPFPSPVKAVYFGNQQGNYAAVGTKAADVAPATPELRILQAGTKSYGTLTSPQVQVAGMSWVELSFRYYRVVEYYPPGSFDKTIVEVGFDGGPWQQVWMADSKTGSEKQWLTAGPIAIQVPSDASTMRVRFVFDSVDHYHNNYLGWLVDDVRIAASGAGTANFAYANLTVTPASGAAPLAITASATVRNAGTVGGTETVRLLVNGSERAAKAVTLGPGASTTVNLTATLAEPGTYAVTIDGLAPVTVTVTGGEIFEGRFDSLAGWAVDGLWRSASGTGCFTCGSLSGSYAYYTVQGGCNYNTGARTRGALASPEFPLQGAQYVRVRFDQFRHVEDYTKAPYDRTTLEVRFEGGAWLPVWTRSSQQPSPECGTVTVGPFAVPAGATRMQVRFVFDSMDSWFNAFPGWAVDNVVVARATTGQPLAALTVPDEGPRAAKDVISVFNIPNPVRDVRTTRFVVRGLEAELMRVEIYDLTGRLVYRAEGPGNEIVWHTQDLTGLPLANGVYLYTVQVKVAGQWISVGPQKLVILR